MERRKKKGLLLMVVMLLSANLLTGCDPLASIGNAIGGALTGLFNKIISPVTDMLGSITGLGNSATNLVEGVKDDGLKFEGSVGIDDQGEPEAPSAQEATPPAPPPSDRILLSCEETTGDSTIAADLREQRLVSNDG